MSFFKLILVAMVAEALWETSKMFWQNGKLSVDRIGAVIFGVFLCLAAGVDFFELVGLPLTVPFAGLILSGLLVSRGANFIHDFLKLVEGAKGNVAPSSLQRAPETIPPLMQGVKKGDSIIQK